MTEDEAKLQIKTMFEISDLKYNKCNEELGDYLLEAWKSLRIFNKLINQKKFYPPNIVTILPSNWSVEDRKRLFAAQLKAVKKFRKILNDNQKLHLNDNQKLHLVAAEYNEACGTVRLDPIPGTDCDKFDWKNYIKAFGKYPIDKLVLILYRKKRYGYDLLYECSYVEISDKTFSYWNSSEAECWRDNGEHICYNYADDVMLCIDISENKYD